MIGCVSISSPVTSAGSIHPHVRTFNGLASQMSISWQDLPAVVERQVEQLNSLQKDLQACRQASVKYEARDLVEQAVSQREYACSAMFRRSIDWRNTHAG